MLAMRWAYRLLIAPVEIFENRLQLKHFGLYF